MGGFAGHSNWYEYAQWAGVERKCEHCGEMFTPRSPNQRKHSRLDWEEDCVECALDRQLIEMSPKEYLQHVGMTKKEYIEEHGIEQYNSVVLQIKPTN